MPAFVYVSNALDGTIGAHALRADGTLEERGPPVVAATPVGPLAVSPDRRFLVAARRASPFTAYSYAIDRQTGALMPIGTGPLAQSFPYITFDRTGRWLLAASYHANLVAVHAIAGGVVTGIVQVVPTARSAHAIVVDDANRHAFVPHLGTDQVMQFAFDADEGRLSANTPPLVQLEAGVGPRHIVLSPDERFAFLLNEMAGTVATLAYDPASGTMTAVSAASALPPDTPLVRGAPRPTAGRDAERDIWASDLHVTPDGRFVYAAERTSSTIAALRVDTATGALTWVASYATEQQPRGFRIDPTGRFMVVSGEKSTMLSTYAIDRDTGALTAIGRYPTGNGSNWVEIVAFE